MLKLPKQTYKRERYPMPADIEKRLEEQGLRAAYDARPPYQQNDYLGWIGRAKQRETRDERLAQMLDELSRGGTYMNMAWKPRD